MVLTQCHAAKKALPIATVLTLPATGSESNNTGMISRRSINVTILVISHI
jgi:alcohol dehydrogenase YqhD (iron-dependent ADH family)